MAGMLNLPKSEKQLVEAIDNARAAVWSKRNAYYIACQMAYYYLQGIRNFRVTSFNDARLLIGYESDLGHLKFRNENLRDQYRTELGRFMRMDIRPSTEKKKWGLDSLRKSAVGQVTLDYQTRFISADDMKMRTFQPFLTFGTVGLLAYHTQGSSDQKGRVSVEVIPGWELYPMPSYPTCPDDLKAVVRRRSVPLAWLKDKANLKLPRGETGRAKMQIMDVPHGMPPRGDGTFGDSDALENDSTFVAEFKRKGGSDGKISDKMSEAYVYLEECWVLGPDNTVSRYIVKVGDHIALDEDFGASGELVPMPLGIAKYIPDCGFYSMGFVHSLMSMNAQVEKMLQRVFKNISDLDDYGALFWPTSAGVGKKEWSKRDGGPRIIPFEPDPVTPQAQPFVQAPFNIGDTPGKLVSMGNQWQDRLANQGPLFSGQAPGRTESAASLGFVFEVQNIGLAAPSHEIANAFAQVYRSMLFTAKATFDQGQTLALTNIDDNVAGVVIDQQTGELSLTDNPIPDFWDVVVDIRDRVPQSNEQKKQEMLMMLQMKLLDPVEFAIENYRSGLGFPIGQRHIWEQYRKAVFNNILMFGDGKQPRGSVYSPLNDNPELHLRALNDFTSRIEFALASPEVKKVFEEHKMMLQSQLPNFPGQMPPIPGAEGEMPGGAMGMGGGMMPGGAGPGAGAGPPGMGPGGPSGPFSAKTSGPLQGMNAPRPGATL